MWRQWSQPFNGGCFREDPALAGIEQHAALAVAANKIARALHVDDAGPAVRVHWNEFPRPDNHFEITHTIVFKQLPVRGRCGDHGV